MSDKLHKNPVVVEHARAALETFRSHSKSLGYATILTTDGFEVASIAGDAQQTRRVASMASSMQALGDAVARDLKMGTCDYIIIAAPSGYVIQLRVPGYDLVIAAHFDSAETLGKALSVARLAANDMAQVSVAAAAA
ncbi:roadblock/LC7 domain-containing protein [Croceicoccus mobilis]|uniref:Roadblock/LAMTOR2 domain-containing protein n=1 Tax=Croceicoccus mobilis TaxID=1703339 RepID=A0A916Z0X8_9SPHN|nr:roadblock/LC7 domain-containing protein [Croceicoccus mobilis]GGD70004.1 hypothetical protein GCM10010990_19410 [Croceicoccus mobilis]